MRSYDKLIEAHRDLIDDALNELMRTAKLQGIQLAGDDRAARAADALATWILESMESRDDPPAGRNANGRRTGRLA